MNPDLSLSRTASQDCLLTLLISNQRAKMVLREIRELGRVKMGHLTTMGQIAPLLVFQFAIKGFPVDAESFGGQSAIAVELVKDLMDVAAFHLLQG
ncbi:hypothetical protein SAMN02745165_02280 [Malonomonas rubra DSM 5091]|uniref:Uncharacterized protein n=1 Tax=Malonomonas rubra DSM 5091 TaxID=1122189 RepID=A0A1M6IXC1_MALRU|nr:hypothetical protein SAMN02745165_02280 [Malonomonas rubra DSM 5091]